MLDAVADPNMSLSTSSIEYQLMSFVNSFKVKLPVAAWRLQYHRHTAQSTSALEPTGS